LNEAQARDEICRIGRSLFERGYVHSTAGNISVRLEGGGFLITPTDSCLGFLEPSELAHVDGDGNRIAGKRASKTLALHRRIYEATSAFEAPPRCVLHTHSTSSVALTLRQPSRYFQGPGAERELLPPITPYFVMKVGHVPVIPYEVPGSSVAADQVIAAIARYRDRGIAIRAVMLERLGPTVWNVDPASAMATVEELEETARLVFALGEGCAVLTESQLHDLTQVFGLGWR
jgi:ribulose-5-phosphate 4-epimerase/fuculose-1-phosphate aldolase